MIQNINFKGPYLCNSGRYFDAVKYTNNRTLSIGDQNLCNRPYTLYDITGAPPWHTRCYWMVCHAICVKNKCALVQVYKRRLVQNSSSQKTSVATYPCHRRFNFYTMHYLYRVLLRGAFVVCSASLVLRTGRSLDILNLLVCSAILAQRTGRSVNNS